MGKEEMTKTERSPLPVPHPEGQAFGVDAGRGKERPEAARNAPVSGPTKKPGGAAKRKHDLPVTPELVRLFLQEYAWLGHSRHKRDRLAYRIIEWQASELAYLRLESQAAEGGRMWSERVK